MVMARSPRRSSLARLFASSVSPLALVFALFGCEAVQEDRTIEFSAQGDSVGFQHGDQGVYVAGKDGGGLKKVFQPGADVLATSTPLWSPQGQRLIFTTARAADGDQTDAARSQVQLRGILSGGADPDPAGERFSEMPVVYTCWLRDEANGEEPIKLFDAKCDHVGYVAANLAVRWHPGGEQIVYVDAVDSGRHGLFAFDMKTKARRKIFPHQSNALIFDWSPNGEHIACVLGTPRTSTGSAAGAGTDGLWIGRPDAGANEWWHVPGSEKLAQTELGSLIEQLRATRPAWTADSQSFAYVTYHRSVSQQSTGESRLCIGRLDGRHVEEIARKGERIRDLHWSPGGELLGFVSGSSEPAPVAVATASPIANPSPTLHTWSRAGGVSGPLSHRPVRRFAGWSAAGDQLAYVVPGNVLGANSPLWAFLIVPDPRSRDAVLIANGNEVAQGTAREVFSGLRVTFPHWSTASSDELLSLWCTFTPSHRSVLSQFLGGRLRSGDPAAVLDVRTGSLKWMAVSPFEEAQIGHYEQIKHAYDEAWRRYEQSQAATPKAGSVSEPEPKSAREWSARLLSPAGIAVFQFHCLMKLNRHAEAQAKLESFRKAYPPPLPTSPPNPAEKTASPVEFPFDQPWLRDVMQPSGLCARLLQDLYIAEVFLSLDASGDAGDYFRSVIAAGPAESESARLSAAVVLSQVLLLEGKHDNYAELCTKTVAPLLLNLHRSRAATSPNSTFDAPRLVPDIVAGLALLPLSSKTFLAGLANTDLNLFASRWESLGKEATDDFDQLAVDVVLEASYRQLGKSSERAVVTRRIERNPATKNAGAQSIGQIPGGVTDEMITSLRAMVSSNAFGTPVPGRGP
jgi:hypothetical protein